MTMVGFWLRPGWRGDVLRARGRPPDVLPRWCHVPAGPLTVQHVTTPDQAQAIARQLLREPLPRRWAHTQGVAASAVAIAPAVTSDPGLLVAAAWLHDIGYAPAIAVSGTGFHPLDGARYLADATQASPLLCRLVAHHSCALTGAAELGLAADLTREFPYPPVDLADALTYCDMTTGPDGQLMPVDQRLAEICARYGPGHTVTRAITQAAPDITGAVDRIRARLQASHS
jgi:hypothetical protein